MSLVERIAQQRLDKLTELRSRGIDPYPARCKRSHTNAEAVSLLEKQEKEGIEAIEVSVTGRIMANRGMGKLAFINLVDGSGKIQLFVNKPQLSESSAELLKDLDIGDFIGASGKVIRTRTGEPSVDVRELTLLVKSLQPLPEKWHGLHDTEKRYRQRYIDLIANPEVKEIFRKRSRVITTIRKYMDGQGFMEVETPMLQPSAGGALARPFITHHNALGCDFYLRIALELHLKRLIVGGFDRVYEIGRVFRNEGIDTKHNPEFTLMECYQAYADYHDIMCLVEEMISGLVKEVTGDYRIPFGQDTLDFTPPWPRLDLRQVVLEKSGIDYDKFPDKASLAAEMRRKGIEFDPSRDHGRLIDDLLSTFVEPTLKNPAFLVNYPIEMSPLAKNRPGDARTVERFEAYAGGTEIANAFSELNDPLEQERRFAGQMLHKNEHRQLLTSIDAVVSSIKSKLKNQDDPNLIHELDLLVQTFDAINASVVLNRIADIDLIPEYRGISDSTVKMRDLIKSDHLDLILTQFPNLLGKLNDHVIKYKDYVNNQEVETMDEDFITALEYGMPPTGGLGIGIDRIVMLITNQQSIREVILFPALKEKE